MLRPQSQVQAYAPGLIPTGFRPALAPVAAQFSVPPQLRRRHYTGRRAEGVRYEKKVQDYLQYSYADLYLASPWIKFFEAGSWRWCQPDGLLWDFRRGVITIVEIKYQHVALAWWQTKQLYAPVLRLMFPERLWKIEFCEIVKWYDPAVVFPEKVILACDVDMPHTGFKVHIYKP